MRLFIAINCNDHKDFFQTHLRNIMPDQLRYRSNFHITLKFLGNINRKDIPNIVQTLKTIKLPRFNLKITHQGTFSHKSTEILFLGFDEKEKLITLQKTIDKKLHSSFQNEKHFFPHITLARIKNNNNKRKFAISKPVTNKNIKITHFELIESIFTPCGCIHRVLEKFPL